MFWADTIAEKAKVACKDKIAAGKPIIIRDEKTASGRVHIGSLRGVAIHGAVSEVLDEEGIKNTYLYEINDFDVFDSVPHYLDAAVFGPYLGKLLCDVPSPDGKAKNYAEYYGAEFIQVIDETGYEPTFYRSSEIYKAGKYNESIKLALEHADMIREIYKRLSGSVKADDWLPINVVCEKCGKISTTRPLSFDGEKVSYSCEDLEWTKGCGHKGAISPYDGNAKMPWKVEWAAKFGVLDVDVEGAGKDHSTKGGARDISDEISRRVFHREPPVNIPYEFFLVEGKKMSSSKGRGSSSREVADLLPPHMLRFLLLKEPTRVIEFVPDGDTIPTLYDTHDTHSTHFFSTEPDDFARMFSLSYAPKLRAELKQKILPRFSQVAYLVQMPHVDMLKEFEKYEAKEFTKADKAELDERGTYAKKWLADYAPEDYKFELQETAPEITKSFTSEQKAALRKVLDYVEATPELDGQLLHTQLHEIRKQSGLEAKDFFSALYQSFLGKDRGPKAGWFFSVIDRNFLVKRLQEVV